jgi:hypothetical protein
MKRVLLVGALVALASVGVALRSDAQSAVCSRTTLAPGQHIGVTGDGATPGTTVTLQFNGFTIGATTADGFGNFAVGGTIPSSATPGLYPIVVTNAAAGFPLTACTVAVQQPAPVSTPAPVPNNATSTATQAPAVTIVPVPIVVQQQQQQQQQQLPAPAPVPEPHFVPVSVGRSSLPTTGADTGEMAQGGTGALIVGASLIEFARRRKRRFATAHSSASTSEGDLFLPFWPH